MAVDLAASAAVPIRRAREYQGDTTVDEIKTLVPSLYRFPMDQIELAINIVVEAKERASGGI